MTTPTITRLKLPAFRNYVESSVWAIHPEKGGALLEAFEARINGDRGALRADEIDVARRQFEARANERRPITKTGGAIAVLPFYGVVAQRMDLMMAYCGGVSTEAFADAFDAAMADPNVSAIVIDCDSLGGNVQGTPELANRILAARGKGKQIVAVANGTMASAAYWICSAADEVVCTPSGDVGSIGVFCVHVDASAMNEMMGLRYTLIKAGEHKAEGNSFEPLSPDAEAFIQDQVNEMNTMFVSAVSKQRGVDAKTVNADFGQGRCFTAKQALAAKMIDRVATLEDTLKRLGAKNVGASGRPVSPSADAAAPAMRADTSDDDEDDLCPECGSPLDDDGNCTADGCDYMTAQAGAADGSALASAPTLSIVIESNAPPPATGAVASGLQSPAPDSLSASAEEPTMDENVKAALEADRKRATEIRALGREYATHGITEQEIDAAIDGGMSYDAATAHFLAKIRSNHRAAPVINVGATREDNNVFKSAGEQLVAVVQAGLGHRVDPRLAIANRKALAADASAAQSLSMQAGTPSGMSEGVGSEGGFFIQNDLLPGIIEPMYTEDPVLSRVTRIPIGPGKNGVRYNVVDEKSRVDGSRYGGIVMAWGDEADTLAASKPKMRQIDQALKKLIGIAYLTDELLEDAPASEVLLVNAFQNETKFMLTNAIFRGKGGGQPLGFTKSGAVIAQAIEATQTIANSAGFLGLNVSKMLANIPASLWQDVIFEYNQELLPFLITATVGTTATVPLFIGAGGLTNRPFDTILGRPAFVSELCEAPGTPGDIVAMAPSQYHLAEKSGAQMATSVHVRFLFDETALRITYRVDGKPVWNSTVTPFKGSTARAPFVTLATRS